MSRTNKRLFGLALAGAAFATLLFGGVACGDDGGSTSGKSVDEVRAALDEELAGELSGDADKVLKHVTARWLKTVLGTTRDEVKADPRPDAALCAHGEYSAVFCGAIRARSSSTI